MYRLLSKTGILRYVNASTEPHRTWVLLYFITLSLFPTISHRMKRFFGKKRKRTPKLPQQPISPDDPSDVATGSSGLRTNQDDSGISGRNHRCHAVDLLNLIAETDSVSTGASSRIAIQDGESEFRAFSPVGIDGTGSGHELPSERFHPCD